MAKSKLDEVFNRMNFWTISMMILMTIFKDDGFMVKAEETYLPDQSSTINLLNLERENSMAT